MHLWDIGKRVLEGKFASVFTGLGPSVNYVKFPILRIPTWEPGTLNPAKQLGRS